MSCEVSMAFQPTLPLRGATAARRAEEERTKFQPTLPLRGATGALRPLGA